MIPFGTESSIAAGVTRYIGVGLSWAATEANVQHRIPFNARIKRMFTHAGGAPGVGESFEYTLRVNGADTSLTVTVSDTDTDGENLTDEVIVDAGDLLSVKIVTSGGASSVIHTVSVEVDPI